MANTQLRILTIGADRAKRPTGATEVFAQYCEALSAFELWNGGTGWPYSEC